MQLMEYTIIRFKCVRYRLVVVPALHSTHVVLLNIAEQQQQQQQATNIKAHKKSSFVPPGRAYHHR